MFNLRDILQLVSNRLYNRALARQQLIVQMHQLISHVALRLIPVSVKLALFAILRENHCL
jgi:hypothetical protein